MECKYTTRVMLYWSGELDLEQRVGVEQHLTTCEACQYLVANLTAVHDEFAELPAMTPARDLLPAAITQRKILGKRFWWMPSPTLQWAAAAILIIAILGGVYILSQRPEPPRLTQVNPSLPFTSAFENTLTVQMQDLQTRVDTLKDTMRGRESEPRLFSGQAIPADKTIADIRTEVETLKTDLVQSAQFPFRTMTTKHRSNSYENHQLYRYRRHPHQSWS